MAEINEYESLVESDVDSDKAELKGSLFANEGVQPDRRAEAIKLAEKMKVPVEFAEQNLDDFKKQNAQISENEYDDLVKSYPASTEFLKDTTNAGLAHDSIDELKNIESKADKSFWDETKNALVFGSMNAVKGMVDFAKMNRDEGKRDWDKLQSNLDPKLRSNLFSIYNDNDLENASKKIAESSKDYMSDDAQKSIIESAKNGDFSGATKAAYLQILQSVPQLALVAVNAEVGLASMFASETGSKYTENLAAGIDPEKAALNARITGAISTGIESIGGVGQSEILKQLIKNSTKALGKESTKQILKSAVKEIGKTAGEEGLEEFATSVSQDLLDYGMDVNPDALNGIVTRAGDAFIVGAGSGGMVGAIQSPMSVMNRYIESNKTKLNADTYEQLGDAAKDSKLRKRSPEKFMEFVEKTTKNTPFENIYIKAESLKEYFQKNNLNTEEELGKLGLLEAYEKAVDTHGELTVPAAEWITKTIDSDVYKGLKDDIRYNAEDLSVNERKKESADVKAEIQKQAAEAKQAENEGKEIIDDVYNQLVEAGVSKAEAKQQAVVYRAFNVLAQRAGISPKELYSKYGLKILGQEQMSVEQQSGYFPMPEVAQGIINLQKNENGAYDYDPEILNQIRNSINQGELIKTRPKVDENGDVVGVLGGASTYPDFFQNKGYTKKLVLGIIDKFNSGRQLTERQIDILNDLYEGAADKINRGEYFQYAGQQSATADINKLDAAMELEKSGKSQDDIFKETGWFKGRDNRWRYEISDDKASFKKIDVNKKKKYKLADVLNHSDLFSAYPSLKDINVEFGAHRGLKGGHFDRTTNTIKVNITKVSVLSSKQIKMRDRANEIMSSPEYKKYRDVFNDVDSSAEDRQKAVADFKATGMSDELMGITMMSKAGSKTEFPKEMPKAAMSILLHEIQHSIQKEEGFARGTNKREAGGFKNYQNTLGEIEARDVENRMDLTPEERKNKTPAQLAALNPIISWGDVKAEMPTKKGQLTFFQKTIMKKDLKKDKTLFQKVVNKVTGKNLKNDLTKSKEFKKWFNGSKVVDDKGMPLVVYHGTGNVFEEFDYSKIGEQGRLEGAGFYFTDKKSVAQAYVRDGGQVMETYLSIKNPIHVNRDGFSKSEIKKLLNEIINIESSENKSEKADTFISNFGDVRSRGLNSVLNEASELIANGDLAIDQLGGLIGSGVSVKTLNTAIINSLGFDGFVSNGYYQPHSEKNSNDDFKIFIALFPSQIKSVRNNGSFNPSSGNIFNQDIKGSFNPDTNTIKLFKSKDQSTFLHESAHLFLNVMNDLAVNNPTESILKDIQTIKEWVGTDDLMSVDAQEKWARGFESYLMTGETPSPALRKAFNTFKVWLTRIYKNVQGLSRAAGFDVSITPEIKGVMDRLIATEEEINSAEAELGIEPLFKDFKGLNEKDQAKYKDMLEESRLYAEAKLNKKLIDELNRKQKSEYKNKFKQNYDAIVNQLKDKPIYKAIEAMKTESGKIDPISVELALGKEMAELIPNNLKSKTAGLDYTIIADAFGFEPTQFIAELVETPTIEQAAKAQTEELMKQEYPELFNEPEIKDEAKIAIHNEKRAELLKFELEYLEKESGFKDAIKKTVRRSPLSKEVKEQAQKYISGVKVKDIKPYLYLRAERQFAKEAGIKLAKGDIKGAFEAKRREYYNYEIYRSAVEAQADVEKTVRNYKKIFKKTEDVAKNRDVDLVNAAREILGRFGIVRGQNVDPATYLAKMKEYDPAQYDNLTNIINDASEGAADYNSVSYDKFVEVKDTVEALWSLAKETKNIQIDGKSVELTQAVADLNSQLDVHTGGAIPPKIKQDLSDIERFKVKLLGAKASLVRAEHWVDLMDLGKSDGVFRKYIWNPVSESITKYRLRKKDVINDYKKIVDEYKDIFTDKPIIAQELDGYVFKQKSHLLMALLHTGNESNKSKLLRGRGWGAVREDGSLDSSQFDSMIDRFHRDGTLTARDYEFAQKIWGLMESLKPDAQKAHKKMYGYYFNEITAREIVTPFGTYSGGYVPAKVDIYTNEDAAIREERNDLEKNNNSFQFPTTGRGFTKARVDSYAAPLSLELNLLAGHIDGVLRFSFVEPHVKQVSRLVMNKEFRAKLGEVDPQIAREMIVPWLQRSAQQKVVLPSDTGIGKFLDGFATILRTNVAMQFMVGNVTNAAQQLTGIIVAGTKVSPRHLTQGLYTYIMSPKKTVQAIYEKSPWMSANQDSNIYEVQGAINEILVNPSVFENTKNFAKAHTYFLQSFTQNIVNSVVWQAGYNQAVENGLSEVEAVRSADSAVRLTQGTTNAEDISRYEVGTATQRLFTQFAGYFNMLANLNASEVQKISKTMGLKKGAGKLFYLYAMGFAIPAILSEAIMVAGRGKGLDEDDDGYLDDLLALFFGSQAKTATAVLPYAGPLLNSAASRFNKVQYDDRLSYSPVLSVLESVAGVPAAIYKGVEKDEIKKQTVKDSLMLLGVLSGLPIGPVGKPVGYTMDVQTGKANPTGPIDFARGLVTGQAGKN